MNNFCTQNFICYELYLFLSQEKLTMLNEQHNQNASKHWASKPMFDRKQWAGADK